MGKMTQNYFTKAMEKFSTYFSFESKELRRVKKIPRYQTGTTKIFGFDFTFVDSASFVGQYEEIFKKQCYQFKKINDEPFIIDCGANVGVSILYYTKYYPAAKIIAFEPDKNIFEVLKQNIEKTGNKNITLINKGLWDSDGVQTFIEEGADGGQVLQGSTQLLKALKTTQIETTRLVDYLDRTVDFLKIDIEGAEAVVIKDCENVLSLVKQIFVEVHSIVNQKQHLESVLAVLEKNDFRYFIESVTLHNERPFIKLGTINNLDNLLSVYAYK